MTYSSAILALARFEHVLRHGDGIQHDLVHVRVGFGQLAQDLLAHLAQCAAAELLVEEVRGAPQLIGRVVALELDDAVLHFAVVEYEHRQHAILGQDDELDVRDGGLLGARHCHDAGEPRHLRTATARRRR